MGCCYQSQSSIVAETVVERVVFIRDPNGHIVCETHYKLKDKEGAVIDEHLHCVPFKDLDQEMQTAASLIARRMHLQLDKKLLAGELRMRTGLDLSAIKI